MVGPRQSSDQTTELHSPHLLSDNGPSYIGSELADNIEAQLMSNVRGSPLHPRMQGKIEYWHQALKSRILQENYFCSAIANSTSTSSSSITITSGIMRV
jgi:hypothetical protein